MSIIGKNIRRNILGEKNLNTYLIYAIMEVLLVVFGILIALAIDNRKQKNNLLEREQTYLVGLKSEFGISKLKLIELIRVNHSNYEAARQIVEYMVDDNLQLEEAEFSSLIIQSFAFDIAFNPNNSLLIEMIQTGSLKEISNSQLRIQLTNWLATLEDITRQEKDLELQREKVIDMFRSERYSVRTLFTLADTASQWLGLPESPILDSNLEILKSKTFENNVLMFSLSTMATETNHYMPLLDDLNSIVKLIDSEIDQ